MFLFLPRFFLSLFFCLTDFKRSTPEVQSRPSVQTGPNQTRTRVNMAPSFSSLCSDKLFTVCLPLKKKGKGKGKRTKKYAPPDGTRGAVFGLSPSAGICPGSPARSWRTCSSRWTAPNWWWRSASTRTGWTGCWGPSECRPAPCWTAGILRPSETAKRASKHSSGKNK